MSQDETMRLVAEVVDKYSGPLKQMMQQLQKIGEGSKSIHDKGAKNVNVHAQTYAKLGEQIRKVKDNAINVLNPSLAAMGVTMFGVSEGAGKLVEMLKGAGERWNALNEQVKRGGVSARYIDIYTRTFERLGIDASRAGDAIAYVGETFDKLKRVDPEEMRRLSQTFPNLLPFIGDLMKGAKDREEATSRILRAITDESISIDQRRKLAEAFGIDPALASKSGKDYAAALRDSIQRELNHPVDVELFKKLHEAFAHLTAAQRDFQSDMTNIFGPPGVKMVEGFAAALDKMGQKYRETTGGHGNHPFLKDSLFGRALEAMGFKHEDKSPNDRVSGAFDTLSRKDQQETIARGTTQGVLDAFRQWMSSQQQSDAQKFANGLKPMAYHPGSDAAGGGGGRSMPRFGSSMFPNLDASGGGAFSKAQRDAIGGGAGGLPDDAGAGLSGSEFLKARRQKFADAMKADPSLREKVKGMMVLEGTPGPTAEALLNRLDMTGGKIDDSRRGSGGLYSGFYGPINRGQLPGAIARLRNNAKLNARMDRELDAVLAGSNRIRGATDQGMPTDPNGAWPGGRVRIGGNVFNDWGGGPGGHEGARRYREALQAGVDRAAQRHGASLRDMVSRGRRAPGDAELLKRGMKAVDAGSLNGSLGVKIDLNGFPKGTRVSASQEGSLLKEVALRRGSSMPLASETS